MFQRIAVIVLVAAAPARADDPGPLFPRDGLPAGWSVREWNDLAKPVLDAPWTVKDGILQPGARRGTWLVSDREYGDFTLSFEIKLSARGNSGVALRTPLKDDPAFVGLEVQIADLRYNPKAQPDELTAAVYRALAPKDQRYRPEEWNTFIIRLKGSQLHVTLNGAVVQDADLATLDQPTRRHDDRLAVAVKDRPRRGHIGFQHLSRNNEPIQIRHARLVELLP